MHAQPTTVHTAGHRGTCDRDDHPQHPPLPPTPICPTHCPFDPDPLTPSRGKAPRLVVSSSLPFPFRSSFHIRKIQFRPPATSPRQAAAQAEPGANVTSPGKPPLGPESAARGSGAGKTQPHVSACVAQTEPWIYSYLINREWKPSGAA